MFTPKPKKGDLLIAEPSILADVSFNRSVILLAEHSIEGSVGFILNKHSDYELSDLIPEIENLYFIHKVPDLIPNSIEISNGIYWAGDFNEVTKLIMSKKVSEEDIRFFLGYSGWDATQLDDELSGNSWIVLENEDKNNIIGKSSESFWKEKMVELGGDYLIWSNAPENPSYN